MDKWVRDAVARINADAHRSADTHLFKLHGLSCAGVDIYLKDESTHPTGSLKHRLARSLFLYALCNGRIREGTPVIEASSGSTAVSEAYFAQMIGVPFIAVVPQSTAHRRRGNGLRRAAGRAGRARGADRDAARRHADVA